jgi:hypothetical protein
MAGDTMSDIQGYSDEELKEPRPLRGGRAQESLRRGNPQATARGQLEGMGAEAPVPGPNCYVRGVGYFDAVVLEIARAAISGPSRLYRVSAPWDVSGSAAFVTF